MTKQDEARKADNKDLKLGVVYSDTHSNGLRHQGETSGGRNTKVIRSSEKGRNNG